MRNWSRILDDIDNLDDPQERGYRFEDLLCELFERFHFAVRKNPGAARPRQSDLFASRDDKEYLIETKWVASKVDVGEIDGMWARLGRAPNSVIGCIFSMSGFTSTALAEVERRRERPILLFNAYEVKQIVSGAERLTALMQKKRQAMTVDGKVWLLAEGERHITTNPLPEPDVALHLPGKKSAVFLAKQEGIGDVLFTRTFPFTRWTYGGHGVSLHLELELETLDDLRGFLATLYANLGNSPEGSFSINQSEASWHGYGAANFLDQAAKWKQRNAEADLEYVHHSEDLLYFDSTEWGYFYIYARQRIGTSRLHTCLFEMHLPGTPVQTSRFVEICEEARAMNPYFAPQDCRYVDHVRLYPEIILEPVGKLVQPLPNEKMVCGLIVKNPFRNGHEVPKGRRDQEFFRDLNKPEFLVCDLKDWHSEGDVIDQYGLTEVGGAMFGGTLVLRCAGTWGKLLKRASKSSR